MEGLAESFRILETGGRGHKRGGAEEEEEGDEMSELEQRIASAKLPEHALKAAQKELKVVIYLP